jgi:hypothetical protein
MQNTPFARAGWRQLLAAVPRWALALPLLLVAAGVGLFVLGAAGKRLAAAATCPQAARAANPIAVENTCPGTSSWRQDHPLGPEHAIEAFAAPISVDAGGQVRLYVSTTASSYMYAIYRIGWYQGLGARLMLSSASRSGIQQPPPLFDPVTRLVSCSNWRDPVVVRVPASWVSGVYLVKLISSQGYMRYTVFVVRNDAATAPILVQTSVITYQAYNLWGGYSLYRGYQGTGVYTPTAPSYNAPALYSPKRRAYAVSFDRPFYNYDGDPGVGDFARYEYNTIRWLERSGYAMTYSTDVDADLAGTRLLTHRLVLAVGHDEYWSTAMRTAFMGARERGVSLGFFGANDLYWHVRLEPSPFGADRVVVCYKPGYYAGSMPDPAAATDPRAATVLWSDPPLDQPEDALLGQGYGGAVAGRSPLVLDPGAAPLLAGTGLRAGDAIDGVVAGEYDRAAPTPTAPAHVTVLAASPVHCIATTQCPSSGTDTATATLYRAASGARVFDAGTFYWGWGLDDDVFGDPSQQRALSSADFRAFTANLIGYLLDR